MLKKMIVCSEAEKEEEVRGGREGHMEWACVMWYLTLRESY